MKAIHAVYENGVFRPLEAVDLADTTEVIVEWQPVAAPAPATARDKILRVLAQRFDSGEDEVAARHNEHQP